PRAASIPETHFRWNYLDIKGRITLAYPCRCKSSTNNVASNHQCRIKTREGKRTRMADTAALRTDYPIKRIIFASGLGTMIEWYDFYIFGSLAVVMSELMFPAGDKNWALIKTWALFATGFVV